MTEQRRPFDTRIAILVFGGWLIGASLFSGLLTALQTGFALEVFGGEARVPVIVAISSLRVSGAHAAVTGAALGVLAGAHRAVRPGGRPRDGARPAALLFAAVPPAALVAAGLMTACGVITYVAVFDGSYATGWNGLATKLTPGDGLFGFAKACVFALVVAAGSWWAVPLVARARWRAAWKYVVIFALVRGATAVTGFVVDVVGAAAQASPLLEEPGATRPQPL